MTPCRSSRSPCISSRSKRKPPGKTARCWPSSRSERAMSESRPQDFVHRLHVGGRERWCLIHLPPAYDHERPLPCVFALHGATSNPRLMERFTGLNDKADAEGFIVAYPAGSGALANVLTWNGGACCGFAAQ